MTLCLSREIVNEYVEVLVRLGLEDQEELRELLALLAKGYHSVYTANACP